MLTAQNNLCYSKGGNICLTTHRKNQAVRAIRCLGFVYFLPFASLRFYWRQWELRLPLVVSSIRQKGISSTSFIFSSITHTFGAITRTCLQTWSRCRTY